MGDPLIHKVDCVRFYVPDLDAGLEFYRDHLGHQLLWRTDKAVGLGMSGTDAEIVLQVEREGPETDLKVDSADAAAARVQMAGGQIIVPPFDIQIGRCAVVEDQWGNRMVLVDSTKGCLLTDDEGHVTGAGVADQMDHPLHVVNAQATVVREGRYLMIVRGEFEEHAPGALSPPGGKVEHGDDETGVLESTVRREVLEETGVTVGEIFYVRSRRFRTDVGTSVVDSAFLCKYESGEAYAADPGEVAEVNWLTAEEIMAHPKARPWTQETIRAAEELRMKLNW